ncbi:HupE/UreJ family protein [Haloferula chungangensis]|uniref:HupE/UreJ family protein n=1 Tax=Haloferula chungangensis TaxID=1048331 RepID=A0ABW2L5G3_9BACT
MKGRWLGWVLLFLGMLVPLCHGHNTRAARLDIEQLGETEYVLRYEVALTGMEDGHLPQLPEQCRWVDEPAESAGLVRLRFASEGRPLAAGDSIFLPWKDNGALVSMVWSDGTFAREFFPATRSGIKVPLEELHAGSGTLGRTARRFTELGIHHILGGIDHLLFVVGLILLVADRRKLILAVTAFTLAHSVTLALSVFGVVQLDSGVVEVLIALSIVLLAKEILMAKQGHHGLAWKQPWIVAFAFGLFHGLGFAGVLAEMNLTNESIPQALLFFNLGVELGQILFVIVCWSLLMMVRRLKLRVPEQLGVLPPYVLGSIAAVWTLERVMEIGIAM